MTDRPARPSSPSQGSSSSDSRRAPESGDRGRSPRPDGGGERPRGRFGGGSSGGGGGRPGGRRKVCFFCMDNIDEVDYKDMQRLRRYLSERGKIEPRRKTGTCARHQRSLTTAIKRSRHVALLPFVGSGR